MKKILRWIWKIIKWLFLSLVVLFLLLFIILKIPATRQYIVEIASSKLSELTGAEVKIDDVDLRLPFFVGIEGIDVNNPNSEDILSVEQIGISIGWRYLIDHTFRVDKFTIEGIDANLYRTENDSAWNYQFILDSFASGEQAEEVPADTSSSAWDVSVGDIEISDIVLLYNDAYNGDTIDVELGSFEIDFDRFSLNDFVFIADVAELKNTRALITLSGKPTETPVDTTSSELPEIGIEALRLENVTADYSVALQGIKAFADLEWLEIEVDEMDLVEQVYHLENIALTNSTLGFEQLKLPADSSYADTIMTAQTSEPAPGDLGGSDIFLPMDIEIGEINLENNRLVYHDKTVAGFADTSSFNPANVNISGFFFLAEDIIYNSNSLEIELNELRFDMQGPYRIKEIGLDAVIDQEHLTVEDIIIQTSYSEITGNLSLSYEDIDGFLASQQFSEASLFLNTNLAVKDAFYYMPEYAADSLYGRFNEDYLQLVLQASGQGNSVNLQELQIDFAGSELYTSATVNDLKNWKRSNFQLKDFEVNSNQQSLAHISGMQSDTAGMEFPESLTLKLSAGGNVGNFNFKTDLATSYGGVVLDGNLINILEDSLQQYALKSKIKSFEFGKLLQSGTDQITMDFQLKGRNLEPSKMILSFNSTIDSLTAVNYQFKDLKLNADVDRGLLEANASLRDTNIIASLTASANLDSITDLELFLDVEAADLQYLKITGKDVRFSGSLSASASSIDTDNLDADLILRNLLFIQDNDRYNVDSLTADVMLCPDSIRLNINSDIVEAHAMANKGLDGMVASFEREFNNYYSFYDSLDTEQLDQLGEMEFEMEVFKTNLLSEVLLPDLKEMEPGRIMVNYSEKTHNINSVIHFPYIEYNNIVLDSLEVIAESSYDSLQFDLGIKRLALDTVSLDNFRLFGSAANNELEATLNIKDSLANDVYNIKTNFTSQDSAGESVQQLQLAEQILLNKTQWSVNEDNALIFSSQGFKTSLLRIENNGSYIQLKKENYSDSLYFEANNFSLANITQLVYAEVPIVDGKLNGDLTLYNDNSFESNLGIQNLSASDIELGNLKLQVENLESNRFELDLNLSGSGSDLTASGYYLNHPDSAELEFNVDLNKLELAVLQSFAMGNISNSSGNISGNISVKGSTSKPDINGTINFNEAKTRLAFNNEIYTFPNERIEIKPGSIQFPNFTINDSLGNSAVIDGRITHENFNKVNFNLTLTTNDYRLLNTSAADNPLYYGTVILDSKINISGPMELPKVRSDIKLEKGTEVTFVVPEEDYQDLNESGLVEFVNFDKKPDETILMREKTSGQAIEDPVLKGIDFISSVKIDEETKLQVVIDPIAGDNLTLRGGANLNVTYSPAGVLNLAGAYEIQEGSYLLTFYNLVKKEFSIREGSRVTWSGDPMDANLDITAVFQTRTSAYPLLATSGTAQQSVKQLLLFNVLLSLEGNLMDPEIGFDIETAEQDRGALGGRVDARLNQMRQDQSEINKQVFALLILNSFMTSGPSAEGPGLVDKTVRNSASQVLTQQLNRLSDQYIKGVNVDLNLDSYAGANNQAQTDLNIDVSKSFFNDKVVVKVGSTVELEGEDASQANNASNLAGNIVIEYKLTDDGRYRFKVFRTTDYEDIVVGQVTRTGAGVIFTRDYNNLKELFAKPENTDD